MLGPQIFIWKFFIQYRASTDFYRLDVLLNLNMAVKLYIVPSDAHIIM